MSSGYQPLIDRKKISILCATLHLFDLPILDSIFVRKQLISPLDFEPLARSQFKNHSSLYESALQTCPALLSYQRWPKSGPRASVFQPDMARFNCA
jgi:hypothetical protein